MRVLTNLKGTVATDALIGRLPICGRHSTKTRVSWLCAEQANAKKQLKFTHDNRNHLTSDTIVR
jgi:hypothetical protein